MKLLLPRNKSSEHSTISPLSVDGVFECYVIEDVVRDTKVWGETAIPAGTYEVVITWSDRFKCMMPLLLNVPNYDGIRIHWGNTDKDTHGCLLVGQKAGIDIVTQSKLAFAALFPKLQEACKVGKVFIEIQAAK